MEEEQFEDYGQGEAPSLHSPLGAIARRMPVTVSMETPLREALQVMDRERIGALIVIDAGTERVRGIFTLQDLLRRVAIKELPLDRPIAAVMTWNLVTMRPHQTAYQAAITMARRNLRHILVTTHDGRLMGIVSQNDLYTLQRAGAREIGTEIRRAEDLGQLKGAARSIRRLADNMMVQGVGAEQLTHFISTLNDLLTLRIIELTEPQFDLPAVDWCWIALGSEGRFEQTFSTDQDNGIIFLPRPGDSAESLRRRFVPFAQDVNDKLDACGFPLCKGGIMAGNPEWCLSLEEWRERFGQWMRDAEPKALLNAAIFFDFRALHGAEELAAQLRDWLLGRAAADTLFLRQLAQNALQCQPPLGLIRDFVYDGSKEHPHTLELKLYGTRPFVDAARIFALANGVPHTSTAQRLRAVADKLSFATDDLNAVIDGFYFIQLLRLRHQQRLPAEAGGANRVDPEKLNEFDRHMLKEAFRQAKKLQGRLALDYRL